jgi:hypothetical protein
LLISQSIPREIIIERHYRAIVTQNAHDGHSWCISFKYFIRTAPKIVAMHKGRANPRMTEIDQTRESTDFDAISLDNMRFLLSKPDALPCSLAHSLLKAFCLEMQRMRKFLCNAPKIA